MISSYQQKYNDYLNNFEKYVKKVLESLDHDAPKLLTDAMRYAISDGGKRVRPLLCIATADMFGIDFSEVKELALAIELIHGYSLVHDDLPAMDNDDYRRGKLSTHKKFGEANGILAGDALLNFAFEHCLSRHNMRFAHVNALKIIAEYAGYRGMIAGQVLDLENEGGNVLSEQKLYEIIEKKTSRLITAPLLVASELNYEKYFNELKDFGYNLGALFQIVDDIMDEEGTLSSIGKTPHKDKEVNKLTAVKVFGLEGAKKRAHMHYLNCKGILSRIPNSEFLSEFTDILYERKK